MSFYSFNNMLMMGRFNAWLYITTQPSGGLEYENSDFELSVETSTNYNPLSYQWQTVQTLNPSPEPSGSEYSDIISANSSTYYIANEFGNHWYRVIITADESTTVISSGVLVSFTLIT